MVILAHFAAFLFIVLLPSHLFSAGETEPENLNPCYSGNHDCDTTAQCVPGEGQLFSCQCATGYSGDGRNCYGKRSYMEISPPPFTQTHMFEP